ncbi:hypothetical protein [Mucilaginibacter ginkgonis]|uniref:Uncharacterized protein n=1 Tax=Mucilaginibacter ginkgonis TaxID=2682091 RepID=A0A6I4HYA6_9SPHI|nr:hypothetical protein [Mucilaginibacter ginkgonis]QQL49484.1 hypothetical protein GO620_015120 [Mucilaginibacter ginkgonis]
MKSILLKLDDKLFEETEKQVKAKKVNRLSYIKKAIEEYNILQDRLSFEKQIAEEVGLLNKYDPDKELNAEFESAAEEDMEKHFND